MRKQLPRPNSFTNRPDINTSGDNYLQYHSMLMSIIDSEYQISLK